LCLAAVPSSRPLRVSRAARRGRQGWPSRRPCLSLRCCQATPCMRPFKSSDISQHSSLSSFLHPSFFVRLGIPFLRPDPHVLEVDARRGCQGRPSLCSGLRSIVSRPSLDSPEHVGTLVVVGDDASEGSSLLGHDRLAPQPCIRWIAVTRTMMHACASAASSEVVDPILNGGTKAMAWHGTPPPRTVIAPSHHAREIGKGRCFRC
jgi:hypothetical protein